MTDFTLEERIRRHLDRSGCTPGLSMTYDAALGIIKGFVISERKRVALRKKDVDYD